MELLEELQLKRFEDVDVFGDHNRAAFAPTSRAVALFDQLKTVVAGLKAAQGTQSVGGGGSLGARRAKSVLLGEMWRDMGRIASTADKMKNLSDEQKAVFVRPLRREAEIVNSTRVFIEKGTPLWAKFVEYELPDDLLTEMQTDLDDYNAAYTSQQGGKQARIGAGATIDELIEAGTEITEELRPIVSNKFEGQGAILQAWKSAVRYPPRPKKQPAP